MICLDDGKQELTSLCVSLVTCDRDAVTVTVEP